MQTLREIRQLLATAGVRPSRRLGQSFLVDLNLLGKVVELAELTGGETVLEVGAGTGSLTEELLDRAARVVAVEIDRRLCEVLRRRLGGREDLALICGDVLAGKHRLADAVCRAVAPRAHLVANLPYGVATPLIGECLVESWRSARGVSSEACRFDRLTFTVQHEVAERLTAGPGSGAYGPISVWTALLGGARRGPSVPPAAFWPRPRVSSRIVRLDFDADRARRLADASALREVLSAAFGHRRKQLRSAVRCRAAPFGAAALLEALAGAGVEATWRAGQVSPEQYLVVANALAGRQDGPAPAAGRRGPPSVDR